MSDNLAGGLEEPSTWPEGRFQGREAFAGLVRQAAALLAREKCSPVVFSDADFSDWPLGERAVVEALHAWAGQGRVVRWLARDFSAVRQVHPRLAQWRAIWSHIVEARAWPAPLSAIWTPVWTMERIDPERCVVVATADPGRCQALRERIEACWERGTPSFPATVLGL